MKILVIMAIIAHLIGLWMVYRRISLLYGMIRGISAEFDVDETELKDFLKIFKRKKKVDEKSHIVRTF
jgi:hypothetical protein